MKYLLIILLFSLPFKHCKKEQAPYVEPSGVEKDSATLARDTQFTKETIENNKIVSTGTIGGYAFSGKSRKSTNIDMMLENGMEMLMNNTQYIEMKLQDDVRGITLSVRVRDLELLNKVPFSYTFTEGKKLIVTVVIKNNQGVNEMYGGTILNVKGRLTVAGINKSAKTWNGAIDAELTSVLDTDNKCRVDNVRFFNAGYTYSKFSPFADTNLLKNKDAIVVQ
jgi:hypothetical protein